MKIIDAFTFFNEIDLLKIRMELLYPYVDAFCICEGRYTFTGREKPYLLEQHGQEFAQWADKIIYYKFEPDISHLDFSVQDTSYNPNSPAWQMERAQRNSLAQVCNSLEAEDIVIVSDLDELPNPEVISQIRNGQFGVQKARLEMQMHYYYLNCLGVGSANSAWNKAFVSTVEAIRSAPDLEFMRLQDPMPHIAQAGWHFSYLGGPERISEKLDATSHTETNRPEINNLTHLRRCVELGVDHLQRPGYEFAFLPVDVYPPRLATLMRKNLNLVKTTLI